MIHKDYYWYKLDNAAKIFPSVSTIKVSNVFRLTVNLKDNVQPDVLQQALEKALEQIPAFNMRLHKGLFWYYFEHNTKKPIVKQEYSYPCRKIDRYTNNGFLFDVTYFEKNINLEVFHALSDGTGGINFLTCILTNYLHILYPKEIDIHCSNTVTADIASSEDSFLRMNLQSSDEIQSIVRPKSYKIKMVLTNNNQVNIIKGIMPTNKIKEIAKQYKTTITVYLTSVLINSIYQEVFKYAPADKTINVCIPVNLRNFFPSKTYRNFFASIPAGINFYKKDYNFDQIIELVSNQFENELTKENLESMVNYTVEIQNKKYLRFLPLFVKNIGLKYVFSKGEKGFTSVLSNLGNINLPTEYATYVERFEFLLSPTVNNSYKTTCCSYNNRLVYAFATNNENTDIQRRFFQTIKSHGADITISAN